MLLGFDRTFSSIDVRVPSHNENILPIFDLLFKKNYVPELFVPLLPPPLGIVLIFFFFGKWIYKFSKLVVDAKKLETPF